MLQAVTHEKGRSFLLGSSERVPREDIMTAGVFGCLQFMSAADAGLALSWLLPDLAPDAVWATVCLWPSKGRAGSEPDAIIRCHDPVGRTTVFVVEAKYGGNRHTERQLKTQWREWASGEPPETARHLLIADQPVVSALLKATASTRLAVTWEDIRDSVIQKADKSAPMGRWAGAVAEFIAKGATPPFDGWPELLGRAASLDPSILYEAPIHV